MGGVLWTETHLKYAYQRRLCIAQCEHELDIPLGIDIYSDYIETQYNNVIHCKCLVPRKQLLIDNGIEDGNIKGMICYCLGYASHVDWTMTMIACEWCKKGYIVFMNNPYSHGRSQGLWMYISSFSIMVNESYELFEYAKKIYTPSIIKRNRKNNCKFNYFIIGQSMGANVALQIALKYQSKIKELRHEMMTNSNDNIEYDHDLYDLKNDEVSFLKYNYQWNGLIFMSPMVQIDKESVPSSIVEFVLKNVLLRWFPTAPVIPTSDLMHYSTRDLTKLNFMNKDPLDWNCNPRLATGWNIINACQFVEANLYKIKLPFIVCHGTDDKVTNPMSSDLIYERAASMDKTMKKYKNAFHHLLMEFCTDQVYDDVTDWMSKHCHTKQT